jgi:hypothetical protein
VGFRENLSHGEEHDEIRRHRELFTVGGDEGVQRVYEEGSRLHVELCNALVHGEICHLALEDQAGLGFRASFESLNQLVLLVG